MDADDGEAEPRAPMNGPQRVASAARLIGYAEARCLAVASVGGPVMDPSDVIRIAARTAAGARTVDDDHAFEAELVRRVRGITSHELREARGARRAVPAWARPYLFPRVPADWLDVAFHEAGLALCLPIDAPGVFAAAVPLVDFIAAERRQPEVRPRRRGDTLTMRRPR